MASDDDFSRYPFVRALSDPAQRRLLEHARVRTVAPRTPLVRRGDAVSGALLVSFGAIRVYYLHPQGRQGTLYWVEPGDACILAMNCIFGEQPYPAWAETDDPPTRLAELPAELLRALYPDEPGLQRFAFDTLSKRVFELMMLLEQSATWGLEQRAAALLLRLADPSGTISTSQERLADHLGTAREVVARILRGMRAEGLVETGRGQVRIVDARALTDLSGQTPGA